MKAFLTVVVIAAAITALLLPCGSAARAGFDNFTYSNEFDAGHFSDIAETDWFARFVLDACNYGFFKGKSESVFDPGGLLTLGEAVKLAARLHSVYHTGGADFSENVPFYAVYAEYALSHGITDSRGEYEAPISRSQFAALVYNALPPEALPILNTIPDYGICDVVPDMDFYEAVYSLYRAGVFIGADRYGSFLPDANITRAEACVVLVRFADEASRAPATPPARIPAEAIYQRSAPAVFMLETFDSDGESIRTGTGFFISDTGLAVTNLHVVDAATSITARLSNGDVCPVQKTDASSDEFNLAILSVDIGKNAARHLNLADSDLTATGSTVYVIGNPLSLVNTITVGVVSNAYRELDGTVFFQFTAPISFGSGGSPILNTLGQVVGVASSSYIDGQNLNLAVPANFIKELLAPSIHDY